MIIVSALDNSGQLHAAELVKVLRRQLDGEKFIGVGSRELADAGCELIYDISDRSAMLTGVIGSMRWALPLYRRLTKLMDSGEVKLVILVDSPTFNLPLARSARKRNIKTFYYVAPQVWAWAQFRVKKIKARVDRLAVILPFEQQYFRDHGIDAHFVGHPFIQRVKHSPIDSPTDNLLKAVTAKRLVLLPGSRRVVISQLLPAQLRIASALAQRIGNISPFIAAWPALTDMVCDIIHSHNLTPVVDRIGTSGKEVSVFTRHRSTLIANADLALAASGTGTLEIAWHGRPMIVMYNTSRWWYRMLGWLITIQHLSLINILADRALVPEFMPYIKDEDQIVSVAQQLLTDEKRSAELGRQLKDLLQPLDTGTSPAEHTAKLVLETLDG